MSKLPTVYIPIQDASNCTILKAGDTIKEIDFSFAVGDSIDLTGASIKMQLYNKKALVFSIEDTDGITIIDSLSFKIDEVSYANNNLPVGTLNGDVQITDSAGTRLTYFDIVYTITKDYTK